MLSAGFFPVLREILTGIELQEKGGEGITPNLSYLSLKFSK